MKKEEAGDLLRSVSTSSCSRVAEINVEVGVNKVTLYPVVLTVVLLIFLESRVSDFCVGNESTL